MKSRAWQFQSGRASQRRRSDGHWVGGGSWGRNPTHQWTFEVSHRRVGNVIRREVYSVTIRRECPRHEEYLSGFSNRKAAELAARRRIDLLQSGTPRIRRRKPARRWLVE